MHLVLAFYLCCLVFEELWWGFVHESLFLATFLLPLFLVVKKRPFIEREREERERSFGWIFY